MEQAERIEDVLTKLKNALAESDALKNSLLERKRDVLDSDAESSEGSERSTSPAASETITTPEGSEVSEAESSDEPEEKPVQKTWCCCFRKQKLK